jgi:hypothetical protein
MLLGYARVSKADDQDTAAQVSALKAAGCTRVYEEKGLMVAGLRQGLDGFSAGCGEQLACLMVAERWCLAFAAFGL